jgi:RHS repeat-associated protein
MYFSALKNTIGVIAGMAVIAATLVGVSGPANAATSNTAEDSDTASISGSLTWQAITDGGSETPDPVVELDATGDTTDGGRDAVITSQQSMDGTYDFEGLPAGSYVVKVTDEANGGSPNSFYPVTYFGGKYSYEAATPIVLDEGQASTGDDIDMKVGATVVGTITGKDNRLLPWVEDSMFSTTAAGSSLSNSINDGVYAGTTKLDEDISASSDGSGNVLIHGIAPDTYAFRYAGDDTYGPDFIEYAPSYWNDATFALDATTLTTELGHTYTINQQLSPASRIGGTLTDAAGTVVRGGYAVLYNTEAGENNAGLVHVTSVDANGNWGFDLIGPGTYRVGFTQAANGVTPTGALAASYPFISSWYGGSSYSSASDIVVTAGNDQASIAGVMPYDESFLDNWVKEQSGGANASEPYCQCFSGDPIDDATGEFYLDNQTDLTLPGAGPAVALDRNYSSANASTDSPFGYGWSSSLTSRLDVITPGASASPQVVQVTQENGATVRFTLDINGNYEAPPRVLANLVLNNDGSWTFTRRAKTIMNFTSDGLLTSIADLNGNTVSYGYNSNNEVSTISGSGGRQINLTWDGAHISGATDSAGRSVSYGYGTTGDLTTFTNVDGNLSSYSYNESHRMLTAVKPDGGATINVYDSSGRVTQQTDPDGRVTTWAYSGDDADSTTTVTAPDGSVHSEHYLNLILASSKIAVGTSEAATTSYQYDEALEMTATTDPLGHSTSYTWDGNGNELTETTPDEHTTSHYYDALDDLTTTIDPDGNYTSYGYDSRGNLLAATTAAYNTTYYTYNSNGTVLTKHTPNGNEFVYGYNPAGQQTTMKDPYGAITTTAYNSAGFVTSTTDPLAHTTTFTVDPNGNVLTATDALGNTTTYSYDADGNRTSTTTPEGNQSTVSYDQDDKKTASKDADHHTTSYSYAANGQIATVTNPDGGKTRYLYNAAEEKTEVINPVGDTTIWRYDLDGRVHEVQSPGGGETISYHNADGLVTTVKDPNGNATTYDFDADGRQIKSTDPLGRVTRTAYTADGKVSIITQPGSSTKSYTYDADGNVLSFKNADDLVTSYTYDADDRPTSQQEPGGITTSYVYDAAGRDIKTTKADGSYINMGYDADNRLTSSKPSQSGSFTTVYRFGSDGERTSMTDPTGTTYYAYDADAHVNAVKNGAGQRVGYTYDPAGNVVKITYPTGNTVNYAYDKAGEMTSVKDWDNDITSFIWNADGKLATQDGADGITETRTYDDADNLTQIKDANSSKTLATYGYGYDAAEQLTSDHTTDPDVTGLDHTYTYDSLGQLASGSDGSTTNSYSATPGGELTTSASSPMSTYNSAQEITAATSAGGEAFSYGYDANGQRTSASSSGVTTAVTNYGYDAYGNLATASLPSGVDVNYTSNADGLRQSETSSSKTQQFVWDTNVSVPLLLDDGAVSYIYGPLTTPVAQIGDASGTIHYLHSDLVGSVRLITSSTGAAEGTTEYDPYGNRVAHTGSADSSIGFSGNWADPETSLIYMRARDYDPSTGQFISIDPQIESTHLPYGYAANDPLLLVDPTGEDWWNPTTWSASTWEVIGTVALAAGAVALAATGVGLVVDGAALVAASAAEAGTVTTIAVETTSVAVAEGGAVTSTATAISATSTTAATGLGAFAGAASSLLETASSTTYVVGLGAGLVSAAAHSGSCFLHDRADCAAALADVIGLAGGFGGRALANGGYDGLGLGAGGAGFAVGLYDYLEGDDDGQSSWQDTRC